MKSILSKALYITAGIVAVVGLIVFIPGGLLILAALYTAKGADHLESGPWQER